MIDGWRHERLDAAAATSTALVGCRWRTARSIPTDVIEELTMALPRTAEQIRGVCADLVGELELTPPFDAWALCTRLSDVRGRRIKVQGADLGGVTVVGHLVALPGHDRILHDSRAPRAQQEMIIYHEVMHLMLGHLADDDALTCGSLLADDDGIDDGPSQHSDVHEWEAETGATELVRLAMLRRRPDEYVARARWHAERGVAATLGLVAPRRRTR